MPIEERFITFDLNEIYKAVVIKCTEQDLPKPPEGKLKGIEIDEQDAGRQDKINMVIEGANGKESVEFDRTFFALALVFYCQGSGIPLPNRGQKTLKILEDKIIMKIELDRSTAK
jgi:hypothetical protein